MTSTEHPDDIFVWPDGSTATREDIDRGDYSHMSDDYRLATETEVREHWGHDDFSASAPKVHVYCSNCGLGGAGPNPPYTCHNCGAEMVAHDGSGS